MIQDDIEILSSMSQASTRGSGYHKLLLSLIEAKHQLCSLTSSYRLDDSDYPSPPARFPFEQYDHYDNLPNKDEIRIVGIILKIEQDQTKFISDVLQKKEIPEDIENLLKGILDVYIKVTDQLERMHTVKTFDSIQWK